jgi:hypothetical protein
MSTPETVIHACKVPLVNASGKPDEKPNSVIAAIRLLANACK